MAGMHRARTRTCNVYTERKFSVVRSAGSEEYEEMGVARASVTVRTRGHAHAESHSVSCRAVITVTSYHAEAKER